MNVKILTESEISKLNINERKKYYLELKDYCLNLKANPNISIGQNLISKLCPMLRNYDLEIRGAENLPKNDSAIIMCNHSNTHDFFTACETFTKLDLPVSVFAASDDLNALSNGIFSFANATLVDRNDKESCTNGLLDLTGKILSENNGVIFGESTWNLHPKRRMQTLKIGASRAAAISGKVIIPTIFEYIEVPYLCQKEKDLFTKCIVEFGKPIKINPEKSLIEQTLDIENTMILMREKNWDEFNITDGGKKKINPLTYVNHTWLKKFGGLGFTYDSASEFKYLYFKPGQEPQNEYHINDNGLFVPGITEKSEKSKVLLPISKK